MTLACIGGLAAASFAQATVIHEYLPEPSEAISQGIPAGCGKAEESPPCVTGRLSEVGAMTVDSGHLFLTEHISGELSKVEGGSYRLDKFAVSSGDFESQFARSQGKLGELATGRYGVAVGHSSGEVYVGAAEEVAGSPGVVGVFSASGALLSTWTGAETPSGSFGSEGVHGVAIDNSSSMADEARGDVYVSSYYEEGGIHNPVVDVFKPGAGGAEPPKAEVHQLTGTCPEHMGATCTSSEQAAHPFSEPHAVAVDESDGVVLVADATVVDVFEPGTMPGEYVFEGQIAGVAPGEPFTSPIEGLAVDGEGDVYISQGGTVVDQFELLGPSGESSEFVGRLRGTSEGSPFSGVTSVAVDPQAPHDVFVGDVGRERSRVDVFGPNIEVPAVATEKPSDVGAASATLNGTVNPEDLGEATCAFVWGTTPSFGHETECTGPGSKATPVPDVNAEEPVEAKIEGLEPDTTYYYRLQTTVNGHTNPGLPSEDESFTTLGPGIRASVSDVAATSATFGASVNPNGGETSAYVEYGRCAGPGGTESCASSGYEASVPAAPGEALGKGTEPVELAPQHVQGLSAGTVYHYRAVAVSEIGGEVKTFDGAEATFTTQAASGFVLPDGRQWELVSPAQKRGASFPEPFAVEGVVQAAADGNAMTYLTEQPTEAGAPGYDDEVQVLSVRGADGWESQDISSPHLVATGTGANQGAEYRFFSEDLSVGVVHPFGRLTPSLSPEATEQTTFLRNDMTGAYTPLVTLADDTTKPFQAFGEEGNCEGEGNNGVAALFCGAEFLGSSPNGEHVVIESCNPGNGVCHTALTDTPAPEGGLYEWNAGDPPSEQLKLISVLPPGEGGQAASAPNLGDRDKIARHAVSDDGSRIIWESSEGHLFMRDTASEQAVRLDAVQGGSGEGVAAPHFQLASSDGSKVFFTDTQQLTENSGALAGDPDLYECEMEEVGGELKCRLSDLTPPNGEEPAFVQGDVIGASEDGAYLYFVADGVLQNDGVPVPGAVQGTCKGEISPPGATCNLYVDHDGTSRLVAVISGSDDPDWAVEGQAGFLSRLTARVSPDGHWLAFMSDRELTGYDNVDANSDKPDEEAYLYDAETGRTSCVSCDPSGARPTGVEFGGGGGNMPLVRGNKPWQATSWLAADLTAWTEYAHGTALYQSRYLSDSGRLFFNSDDALVPQDGNGTWDVYEYEPPGVGSCTTTSQTFHASTDGCTSLISSGTSGQESVFLDASETGGRNAEGAEGGGDVFFMTSEKLSPLATESGPAIYDAHECSTAAPCFPAAAETPPPCDTEASCKASPTPQPSIYGAPASATFSGPGNKAPALPAKPAVKKKKAAKCPKGKTRDKKGKCVPKKKQSKKRAKKTSYDRRSK